MNKSDETSWARWKRRARYVGRRYPLAIFAFAAVYSYFADCFIAHKSHPEVSWIESGIYCRGPFGFVATVAIVVVGVGYCLKKGL
jgi:hypothetical protein